MLLFFNSRFFILKIIRKNCCGLDVLITWIYAFIGITDANECAEISKLTSLLFQKDLRSWLASASLLHPSSITSWIIQEMCHPLCMVAAKHLSLKCRLPLTMPFPLSKPSNSVNISSTSKSLKPTK